MRYGFLIEWTLEDSLKGSITLLHSRRWREPNPLSIRHVCLYMREWTISQFEWYRDNDQIITASEFFLRRFLFCDPKKGIAVPAIRHSWSEYPPPLQKESESLSCICRKENENQTGNRKRRRRL